MLSLDTIADFLADYFNVAQYPVDERGGMYHPSDRLVQRLGLALEPKPDLGKWTAGQQLDALWLHRPWQLPDETLPPNVGVIYHHLPFDETLTMGFNLPLADALSLVAPDELGYKQADGHLPKRPIGMIGNVSPQTNQDWLARVTNLFGGYDQANSGSNDEIRRVAIVGAMNDALIREAAKRGADVYLTGQYRKAAQEAVDETGMAVIAVGHRRSEEWGLMALTHVLQRQFPALTVVHKKSGQPED